MSENVWKTFVTVSQGYDKLFTNKLVNQLVQLSHLIRKQLLNNEFYALLDQL